MAEPTTKHHEINRLGCIRTDICALCAEPANWFKDQVSVNEYRISGLCQTCQDKVFVEDNDDVSEE
jgi:hypothetical protein